MVSTALIKIWDTLVGGIAWDQNTGIGSFEFEPAFLEKGWNISPLKMPIDQAKGRIFSFPELRDNQLFKGLPGMLADVLPDRYGKTLINVWLANNGRLPDSMNQVELLCYIGKRGMGALEFEPPIPNDKDNSGKIEL